MGLVFFGTVVPTGVIMRAMGKGFIATQSCNQKRTVIGSCDSHQGRHRNDERSILGQLRMDFLIELWRFMRVRKKFWLLPILVMMLVFGGLVILVKGSAVAPFIYTLF